MENYRFFILILMIFTLYACNERKEDCSEFVNVFIGAAGDGHTWPGACLPFGMVQLSPDTRLVGQASCGGYYYPDSSIIGFSHTHLSGVGEPEFRDVLFMPTTGEIKMYPGQANSPSGGYRSSFRHENEKAGPGYYSVMLDDYNVKVELTATARCGFHKYTFPRTNSANIIIDQPVEKGRFYYDDDGMLVINGKRTFIIGSYHHPKTDRPYEELAKHGYNYTRVKADKAELDSSHAHHLMTWMVTGSIKSDNRSADKERIALLVNRFKNHPSLLCWEMEDEPAFAWNSAEPRNKPEPLIETYRLIKQEDPQHLVITNHGPVNLISTLAKYNRSTDIVACDVYPVIPYGIEPTYALYPDGLQGDLLNPYISQVGEYVDKMKKVVNDSMPVFMVLQAFAWEMLKKEEDRDTTMILYPGYEESRFMAFNAIVHGATGILYWGSNYTPQPSACISDLNKVTGELAKMQKILAANNVEMNITKEYHELRYSVDAGIEILAKKVNDKYYLLTVNSDKNPVKVSLTGLDKYKSAIVLSEDRTVTIEKGKLTDLYEPFDVHIYELNK